MREAFSASLRRYFSIPGLPRWINPLTFFLPCFLHFSQPQTTWEGLNDGYNFYLFVCSFRWYQDYRTNQRSHRYGFCQRAESLSKMCRTSYKSVSHFRVLCIYFLLSLKHFPLKRIDWLSGVWNREVLKLIYVRVLLLLKSSHHQNDFAKSSNVPRYWSWKYIYCV